MRVFGPTPQLQYYPKAIQDLLNKSELMGRSAEDQRQFDENIKFIENLGQISRANVEARLILLLLTENVRKDFQIHHLREEIYKLQKEVWEELAQLSAQEKRISTLEATTAGLTREDEE